MENNMKKTLANMYKLLIDENIPEGLKEEIYVAMEYLANK